MSENYTKLVEDHWSTIDCSATDKNFYCYPPIRSHSCKLIFDEYDARRKDWCEFWTVEKYLKDRIPFERCLSICCGFGEVERNLYRLNLAKKIIGTDIAPGAIQQAQERAKTEALSNIEYYISDLNNDALPINAYDIVWANGALHHIKDLDSVISKLSNTLQPNGYLISNEYVGPKYQQIGKRQQEIINAVRHLLPEKFCQKTDHIYDKIWNMPTVEYFLDTDPSECVNSNNIIPTLRKYFNNVEVKYFNGSILMYALDLQFYDNFDSKNTDHKKLLEMLFNIEDSLISMGELPRDNAHIICKK